MKQDLGVTLVCKHGEGFGTPTGQRGFEGLGRTPWDGPCDETGTDH